MAELGFSWHDFPIVLPFPTPLILLQGKQKPREQKCLHKPMWQMSGAALDVNTASVNYCFVTNISCQTSDLKLPWLFISHDLENWLASPPADFAGLTQLCFLEGRWCWGIQAGLIHSQAVGSGQGSLVPLHVASYALIGKISSLKWQSQGRNGVRAEASRTLKVWTRTGTGIPCTDFYWSKQVSV